MKQHGDAQKKDLRKAARTLSEALLSLETPAEARAFLEDLCTPAELQALADRWAVVDPLSRGEPYRRIHDQTGVSVTTIGRVARFLTDGNGGYQRVLRRLNRDAD